MKILALDSTGKTAAVAVADGERILSSYTADSGLTQSEILLPMARSALTAAHMNFFDVELFAVTVGPGSFTGVRIGAALVKGLAFGRGIPCAAVSVLEALAENLRPLPGIYCPVLDARRNQVYNALFCEKDGALCRMTPDRAIATEELLAELAAAYPDTPIFFVGDGAALLSSRVADFPTVKAQPVPHVLLIPNGGAVARCGLRTAQRGELTDDISLSPVYLRLPQAERERLAREQEKKEL